MACVADLHIHSSYAYATARDLSFENLALWARHKGIDLLASADFTHPVWFEESRSKLSEAGDGLFEYGGVRFTLGTELSCVARVGGRGRRVHMLAFAPSFEAVAAINLMLSARGAKLAGDGRPTLRMSPRDLLETLLGIDARCIAMPAHAWTPWYGVFGSKSGFDSLAECFGDMTPYIPAVESGLSGDPAMCWRIPDLDDVSIVSFSDAHSLPRLGRELTVFDDIADYDALADALRSQGIAYTVELFPEEGKYYYSGHRKCGVSRSPKQIAEDGMDCPKCGRALTLGVAQRVEDLAARESAAVRVDDGVSGVARSSDGRPPFMSLVSLEQILSELLGVGIRTKRVRAAYLRLVETFGDELSLLTEIPSSDIARELPEHGARLAEGIERVRAGSVHITPGYDGQYGKVRVWPADGESLQAGLFG